MTNRQALEFGGRNGHYFVLKFFEAGTKYEELTHYFNEVVPYLLANAVAEDGYKAVSVNYTIYSDRFDKDTTLWVELRAEKK